MSTIGIIGGMGPLATVELFKRIVSNTDSSCDEEHIRILIDNNPKIPDRTCSIIAHKQSPVNAIVEAGKGLISLGADLLLIPCNTSFCFISEIQENLNVPIINMIQETVNFISRKNYHKVGLLATDGTIYSQIYQNCLSKREINCVIPDDENQKYVMDYIYKGVKAGMPQQYRTGIEDICNQLFKVGAESIILGCTELSADLYYNDNFGRYIDPLQIVALKAIIQAGYRFRRQNDMYKICENNGGL